MYIHQQNNIKKNNLVATNYSKTEILGIQVLKFICALLVVSIHYGQGVWGSLLPLSRIAVPIFFIITGYFLDYEISFQKKPKLYKRIIKIIKLSIFSFGLYLLFAIISGVYRPDGFNYWLKMVIFGNVPRGHLWYLISLLQSLGFIYICCSFKKTKWLYWLIPFGLILNLLFGSYNFIIKDHMLPNNLLLSRNTLTIGLPCILIGMLIKRFEPYLPSQKLIAKIACVGILGLYIETVVLQKMVPPQIGDIVLLTIPVSTTVFVYFLRLEIKKSFVQHIAFYGRAYSLDIYIWHVLLGSIILFFIEGLESKFPKALLLPIILFVTILFCKFIKKINLHRFYS